MTVLLSRAYAGYTSGQTVQVPTVTENAIVSNGYGTVAATTAAAAVTTGALTTSLNSGRVTIAAGASSVVVTNSQVDVNSKIYAVVNQAAADTTLLRVERIVPAAGSFTIYGTANATANISIDWALISPSGGLTALL
jgi:glutamate 5-kinase